MTVASRAKYIITHPYVEILLAYDKYKIYGLLLSDQLCINEHPARSLAEVPRPELSGNRGIVRDLRMRGQRFGPAGRAFGIVNQSVGL